MHSGRSFSPSSRGFTLVELLVVISIIALLMGILLPALGSARSATHVVVCGAQQRSLGQAWLFFAADNNDYIPSPGVIGETLMTDMRGTGGIAASNEIGGDATQAFDWAGAIAFTYLGITRPDKRDERFAILNGAGENGAGSSGAAGVFSCPANHNISVPYNDGEQPGGIAGTKFQPQLAMSYSAAREFMWWGQGGGQKPRWATRAGELYWGGSRGGGRMNAPGSWSQWLPGKTSTAGKSTYRPRLERIGNLSRKYMLADGARYLDPTVNALDHDVSADAQWGGAFADVGAWASEPNAGGAASRAWPIGRFENTGQEFTPVAFRHLSTNGTDAKANVVKFDGSVETVRGGPTSDFRRPEHWYPSGSSMKLNDIPEVFQAEYAELASGAHAFVARVPLY